MLMLPSLCLFGQVLFCEPKCLRRHAGHNVVFVHKGKRKLNIECNSQVLGHQTAYLHFSIDEKNSLKQYRRDEHHSSKVYSLS